MTLTVHSSLEAVGLTAAFATELSNEGISCNVVAAFYHDPIFVTQKDAGKAIKVLQNMGQPGAPV
ncbi:MAG: ACT domain-containing protein [Ferruginibacter sp.]